MNRLVVMLCLTLAVSACVSIPAELASETAFSPTTPMQAQNGEHDGEWVRWGGVIIKTTQARPDLLRDDGFATRQPGRARKR